MTAPATIFTLIKRVQMYSVLTADYETAKIRISIPSDYEKNEEYLKRLDKLRSYLNERIQEWGNPELTHREFFEIASALSGDNIPSHLDYKDEQILEEVKKEILGELAKTGGKPIRGDTDIVNIMTHLRRWAVLNEDALEESVVEGTYTEEEKSDDEGSSMSDETFLLYEENKKHSGISSLRFREIRKKEDRRQQTSTEWRHKYEFEISKENGWYGVVYTESPMDSTMIDF